MITIIQHTPPWVFAVFLLLLWRGWLQTRERYASAWRAGLLPLAMMLWSASRLVGAPLDTGTLAWLTGFVLAATVASALGYPRGIVLDPEGRGLRLPGSWTPFVLMMLVFCLRYADGVAQARAPALAASALFAGGIGLVAGCVGGLFFARTLAILRVATRRMLPA